MVFAGVSRLEAKFVRPVTFLRWMAFCDAINSKLGAAVFVHPRVGITRCCF